MPRRTPFEELDNFSTIDILTELRRRYTVLGKPPRSAVLLGPPGTGRASLAAALRRDWGLCVIDGELARSSGDALHAISEKLASAQCRRGFALHRFPESAEEARGLDKMIDTDFKESAVFKDYRVILLDSQNEEALSKRSAGKLVHQPSGRIYHRETSDGVDEVTGAKLTERSDSFGERFKSWVTSKEGLMAYFKGSGRAVSFIDAGKKIDEINEETTKILM